MKIYIHTDLEGISGIDTMEMVERTDPGFGFSVKCLMADVNAAIDGAFAGGATHVTVLDGHHTGDNFDIDLLDKRVELDRPDMAEWWGKLDESYAGIYFIGAHAMAGTMNAFLDHTMASESWFNYRVNGRRVGELGLVAMVAAHFKVPMLMVSGDEAACTEARQFLNPVRCAAVKRGIGRNRAELVARAVALSRIYEEAREAVSLVGKARLYTPTLPMELKLEFYRSDYCDEAAGRPGNERLDARALRKVSGSYLDHMF